MSGIWRSSIVAGATLALCAAALSWGDRASAQSGLRVLVEPHPSGSAQLAPPGGKILKAGLFDWLFGGSTRGRRAPPPSGDDSRDDEHEGRREHYRGTFKTVCVRLCDGFYFPISASSPRETFASDAKRCEQSCPTRSRLFVHRTPGEGVDNMVDLEGHRYRDLPTAFQHLTRYDPSCTCRGNPWDEEALARHRAYAQEAERKPADQVAQHPLASQPPRPAARQTFSGYRDRRARRNSGDSD
jgi:hypothetical protein